MAPSDAKSGRPSSSAAGRPDRKSTRLNSSHLVISYAVFCLKKKQRHSHRIVAIKRILSFHADSQDTLSRLRREAHAVPNFAHPNFLPTYDVIESHERLPSFS